MSSTGHAVPGPIFICPKISYVSLVRRHVDRDKLALILLISRRSDNVLRLTQGLNTV